MSITEDIVIKMEPMELLDGRYSGKKRLCDDFLLPALKDQTFGKYLQWVDPEKKVFRVLYRHKNGNDWSEDCADVFVAWDQLKGRHRDTSDYFTRSRQRFRVALSRCPKLQKIPAKGQKHVEYFKIVPHKKKEAILNFDFGTRESSKNKAKLRCVLSTSGAKYKHKSSKKNYLLGDQFDLRVPVSVIGHHSGVPVVQPVVPLNKTCNKFINILDQLTDPPDKNTISVPDFIQLNKIPSAQDVNNQFGFFFSQPTLNGNNEVPPIQNGKIQPKTNGHIMIQPKPNGHFMIQPKPNDSNNMIQLFVSQNQLQPIISESNIQLYVSQNQIQPTLHIKENNTQNENDKVHLFVSQNEPTLHVNENNAGLLDTQKQVQPDEDENGTQLLASENLVEPTQNENNADHSPRNQTKPTQEESNKTKLLFSQTKITQTGTETSLSQQTRNEVPQKHKNNSVSVITSVMKSFHQMPVVPVPFRTSGVQVLKKPKTVRDNLVGVINPVIKTGLSLEQQPQTEGAKRCYVYSPVIGMGASSSKQPESVSAKPHFVFKQTVHTSIELQQPQEPACNNSDQCNELKQNVHTDKSEPKSGSNGTKQCYVFNRTGLSLEQPQKPGCNGTKQCYIYNPIIRTSDQQQKPVQPVKKDVVKPPSEPTHIRNGVCNLSLCNIQNIQNIRVVVPVLEDAWLAKKDSQNGVVSKPERTVRQYRFDSTNFSSKELVIKEEDVYSNDSLSENDSPVVEVPLPVVVKVEEPSDSESTEGNNEILKCGGTGYILGV